MVIEIKPSALMHGLSEQNILHVFHNYDYDGPVEDAEGFDNRFIRIGFDTNANLLELIYNEYEDDYYVIFHAMKCRSIFYYLLEI
jgi:hypothetical protein